MNGSGLRCWAEVDLDAIRDNIKAIRSFLPAAVSIMAVVKADAYGHGMVPVARAAMDVGVDGFGVATVEEGKELRGITDLPIYLLMPFPVEEVEEVVERRLIPLLSELEIAEALSERAKRRGVRQPVHVKVDTGMSRAGFPLEGLLPVIERIDGLKGLRLDGLATHFASSDDPTDPYTEKQLDRFDKLLTELDSAGIKAGVVHSANSGAIFNYPRSHYRMVRPGISIYGYYPSQLSRKALKLRQALTWKARVVHIKDLPSGSAVSYGRTYITDRPTRLAAVSVGYGDGFTWFLSNQAKVLVRGHRAPVIGRVCMDITAVDASQVPGAEVGDEVVLLGDQGEESLSADDLAEGAGTINYQILTGISRRVPRIYLNGEKNKQSDQGAPL